MTTIAWVILCLCCLLIGFNFRPHYDRERLKQALKKEEDDNGYR